MKRLILGALTALAIALVGAPVTQAAPVIDYDEIIKTGICSQLDAGYDPDDIVAELESDWAEVMDMLNQTPDWESYVADAVAEKCPEYQGMVQ